MAATASAALSEKATPDARAGGKPAVRWLTKGVVLLVTGSCPVLGRTPSQRSLARAGNYQEQGRTWTAEENGIRGAHSGSPSARRAGASRLLARDLEALPVPPSSALQTRTWSPRVPSALRRTQGVRAERKRFVRHFFSRRQCRFSCKPGSCSDLRDANPEARGLVATGQGRLSPFLKESERLILTVDRRLEVRTNSRVWTDVGDSQVPHAK